MNDRMIAKTWETCQYVGTQLMMSLNKLRKEEGPNIVKGNTEQ